MATASHLATEPDRSVLVTGAGGPSGRAAIEALRARGYRVVAVDMRAVENAADAFFMVPPVGDPAFLDALLGLIEAERISWLFPTVSEELVVIADCAAHIRSMGTSVFIGAAAPVAICHDKWATASHLRHHSVAVPASAIAIEDVARLGYPMVSKPRVGRGGRGVTVHDGPGGPDRLDDAVWQRFLPGTEYDVLLMIHPDDPARVLVCGVLEKTELREGRTGNAVTLVMADAPDVAALAAAAAKALGLTGPLDIDIRRDAQGVPHVLEINARIGAHVLRVPEIFDAVVELHLQGHLG